MKRLSILWFFLLFCPVFLFAQESMTLDNAIMDAVNFFSSRLEKGTVVAVTNFEAETKELSDFIIQELLDALANTGNVRVVERSRLEVLQAEWDFSTSGLVSEETRLKIGGLVGAKILFYGSISQYRDMYRMRVQAIAYNGIVVGSRTLNIKYDAALAGFLGKINPADAWKYQWFYAGFNVGYSQQIDLPDDNNYPLNIPLGFSIYARFQPFDLFGIALDFSGDLYDGPNLSIAPTLTIRPSFFEIDLFLGIGINFIPAYNGAIAFTGGGRAGIKLGPGVLFAEVRPTCLMVAYPVTTYSQDSEQFYTYETGETAYSYYFKINFLLGYQVGLFQRKK